MYTTGILAPSSGIESGRISFFPSSTSLAQNTHVHVIKQRIIPIKIIMNDNEEINSNDNNSVDTEEISTYKFHNNYLLNSNKNIMNNSTEINSKGNLSLYYPT